MGSTARWRVTRVTQQTADLDGMVTAIADEDLEGTRRAVLHTHMLLRPFLQLRKALQ